MYIKNFRPKHKNLASAIGLRPEMLPGLGWIVMEHGEALAIGFLRRMEGPMMVVEGPFALSDPSKPRTAEAKNLLIKHFQDSASTLNVDLVTLKPFKSKA